MKKMMIKAAAIIMIIALFLLTGCVSQNIKQLQGVEVREYQGEKLSSIGDLKDVSIKGPQYINSSAYKLEITGLVNNKRTYTYDQVLAHQKYSKIVTLNCVEGWSANLLWKGIMLKDLFSEVGVKPEANTVIFYAVDGYTSSLPLDYVMNNNIIMAYELNNVTLPPQDGFPFIIVAESKFGYKWVKWVTKIELSSNANYRGYWESNGYSNSADI